MSNQIVLRQDSALAMENAIERYNMLVEFIRHIMQKDIDFGIIPGAGTKPTLYKPGAEKLNNLFSHYPTFSMLDKVLDFDNGRFYFQYQCDLYRIEDGKKVGSGNGSCNSLEVKYRYRQGERKCPTCGKPTIIKGKAQPTAAVFSLALDNGRLAAGGAFAFALAVAGFHFQAVA